MGNDALAQEYIDAANEMIIQQFGDTNSVIVESGGVLDPNNASAGKAGKVSTETPVDMAFYDDATDFFQAQNVEAGDRVGIISADQLSFVITTKMSIKDGDVLYKIIDIETQRISGIPIVQFLQIRA